MAEFTDCFQHLFSIFDQLQPLCEKNGIQKKQSYIRADGSNHESTRQGVIMQRR